MLKIKAKEAQELQEKRAKREQVNAETDDEKDFEIDLLALGAVDVSNSFYVAEPIKEEVRVAPKEIITFEFETVADVEYGSMRQDVRIDEPDDE
jgi:hypothetical protein